MINSGRDTPGVTSDFERTLRQRSEIPLFAAARLFEEFSKDLREVLNHPRVVERTEQLGRLLSVDASAVAASGPHVSKFCSLVLDGFERRESTIAPTELLDSRGLRLDASKQVTLTDTKTGMLQAVMRDALERVFLQPKNSEEDVLLVEKMLSLVSAKREETRVPMTVALLGAFAEVLHSPGFSEPAQLTQAQHLFMSRVFSGVDSAGKLSEPILVKATDQAYTITEACRRHFIRGDRAGLLPQELNRFALSGGEKQGIALIKAMYLIEKKLLPPAIDAGVADLSRLNFNDSPGAWAAPFLSPGVANQLRGVLGREMVEQMIHRTHNIGIDNLRFLTNALPDAFAREGHPRTIWPEAEYLERSEGIAPNTNIKKPR